MTLLINALLLFRWMPVVIKHKKLLAYMAIIQKTLAIFKLKVGTVRGISILTKIPKSTVHYQRQKIDERIEATGTDFWETELGHQFIIRLVVSSIFVFCLKSGNGAGRIKEYFELLEIDDYVPASQSSILNIIKRIESLILEYKKAAEEGVRQKVKEIELILGVDETWFDKMYLVCQELSSGYIFFETVAEKRDAATWNKQIKKKLFGLLPNAKIMYFVSDRAKALVNLAVVVHEVTSVADCFHFKYCINKLLCLALASKLRWAKASFATVSKNSSEAQVEITSEKYAQIQFYTDLYVETMGNISHIIHPFYQGNKTNTSDGAEMEINTEFSNIEQIVDNCQITDKYKLFRKAQQQVPDVTSVISLWHQMKEDKLAQMGLSDNIGLWFREYLLPKTYWELAIKKTKYAPTRDKLNQELQKIGQPNKNEPEVEGLSKNEIERLSNAAVDLCRKFQRTSSQVEGRNGYLSLINHNQRSFDDTRLKVLTVIHNFDTRGLDKKTPAERLFGDNLQFKPLANYIIDNFGDLPRPRNRYLSG